MDPQAPEILPYCYTFHPTLADAESVRSALTWHRGLPPELASRIVAFGYSPWIVKRRVGERVHRTIARPGAEYGIAGLYLSSDRIPTHPPGVVPQHIVFQTRASDQGWATFGGEGTFSNSHTWFEASILRPAHPGSSSDAALGGSLAGPFWDVECARAALRERGWEFVERAGGGVTWHVCNHITAQSEHRNYRVEWKRGVEVDNGPGTGKSEGFLEHLEPGFIVALWARADELNWVHKVGAASIEIEYELP